MFKYYGAFIVSQKPIDLSSIKANMEGIEHLLYEKFELVGDGKGGWIASVDATKYCRPGVSGTVNVTGQTVPTTILNWLRGVILSFAYLPQRDRK